MNRLGSAVQEIFNSSAAGAGDWFLVENVKFSLTIDGLSADSISVEVAHDTAAEHALSPAITADGTHVNDDGWQFVRINKTGAADTVVVRARSVSIWDTPR